MVCLIECCDNESEAGVFDAGSDAIPNRSYSNINPKAIASHKRKNYFTGEETGKAAMLA